MSGIVQTLIGSLKSFFAVLPSTGTPTYFTPNTVRNSAGVGYVVIGGVRDSSGNLYIPK